MIGTVIGLVAGEGIQILAKQAGKSLIPIGASKAAKVAVKLGLTGMGMLVGQAVEDSINRACEEMRSAVEELAGYEVVDA